MIFFPSQAPLLNHSTFLLLVRFVMPTYLFSLCSCYSPELSLLQSNLDRQWSWNLLCTLPSVWNTLRVKILSSLSGLAQTFLHNPLPDSPLRSVHMTLHESSFLMWLGLLNIPSLNDVGTSKRGGYGAERLPQLPVQLDGRNV